MDLVYLYLSNHKGLLVNQALNFSSDLIINFDETKNLLTIDDNSKYIEGFFNLKNNDTVNFSSISAIIGKNGTGKTTILEYIGDNLINGLFEFENQGDFAIFRNEHKLELFSNKQILFKNNSNIYSINFNKLDTAYYENNQNEFQEITLIYFSNIFDGRNEHAHNREKNKQNFISISTNELIYRDYDDFRNRNYDEVRRKESTNEYTSGVNYILAHRKLEFKRQAIFFLSQFAHNCPIKIPSEVSIELSSLNVKSIVPDSTKNEIENNKIHSIFSKVDEAFNKYRHQGKTNKIPLISILFYSGVLYNFINFLKRSDLLSIILDKIEFNFDDNSSINEQIFNYFDKIVEIVPMSTNNSVRTLILANRELIETFDDLVKDSQITIPINFMVFDTTNNQLEKLKVLIDRYLLTKPQIDYIDFSWIDLSSGEKAMLNIYSRFYETVNHQVNRFQHIENSLIIMIDEGDIYLHPQWQKSFLLNLLKYFNLLYKPGEGKKRNIQIILTSHSPIVLSDLPKDNVIFLEKGEDGYSRIAKLEDQKQTFASNIYTLYTDSFFIKDGLIGDFARIKLDDLFKIIENENFENFSEEKIQYIKNSISIIGEEVIKSKLVEMLQNRLNTDLISIHRRLEKLEKVTKLNDKDKSR